jgi:6-phosphogluconolactonase
MAAPECRDRIDWSRVEFFWCDERVVPPAHPDSNYRMAKESLLSPLRISPRRVHRMPSEEQDLDGAAAGYQEEIARVCGGAPDGPPPVLDVVLLGMGADGHTASLFPHTEALRETRRWVVANPVPQLPTHRLTMTPALLNRAHQVLFLVAGSDKAERLAEIIEGPRDPERLPSQLVSPASRNLAWFVDTAAGSQLRKKGGS